MRANVHYFQHVPFEGLGAIEGWATRSGHRLSCTRFCDGDPLPALEEVDWLVIMGGPMSVHDERAYPWLKREERFIESAIRARRVVLGVCLGAQLVADVLGAKVHANRFKEIGWFPIQRTADAVRLAQSEGCENQGFVYHDRVVGLQFHLEVTKAGAEQLVANCAADLTDGPFVQQPEMMLGDESRFSNINDVLVRLLDQLTRIAVDRA